MTFLWLLLFSISLASDGGGANLGLADTDGRSIIDPIG